MSVYIGFIIPTVSLVAVNLMIIWKATRFQRSQFISGLSKSTTSESNKTGVKRKREMTRTILVISFVFVVISLPANVIVGYYLGFMMSEQEGQLVFNFVVGLQMSYPAFNFFILFFSNKLFSQEVKSIVFDFTRRNKNRQ